MDIYWVKDGKRQGPATVPDVISLVHLGELSTDTLGWHAGCKAWMPLRELPAVADFLTERKPEAEKPDDAPAPEAETEALPPVPSGTETDTPADAAAADIPHGAERVWMPSPSTRMLARAVDVMLYMGLVYSAVYVQQLPYSPNMMPSSPLFWLGFIATEAVLLSFFGTTPGKSFFRIRIVAFSGGKEEPLGLLRSLGRAMMVFVGGMGMMCSFLPVLMGGFSWWMLKKHHITYWDARMSTFPAQRRPTGFGHLLLSVLILFFCLEVTGLCLQPWMPAVLEEVQSQSPEAAQALHRFFPALPAPEPTAGQMNEK